MTSRSIAHALAAYGVAAFALVCGAAQVFRCDLDWVVVPLSAYLTGPGGGVVTAAYLALSAGLLAIGFAFRVALVPAARSAVPPVLFATSGVALALTALTQRPIPADPSGGYAFAHGIAAIAAFLCVTMAMLLQSWWLRADPRWRASFGFAFGLAFAAFAALWIHALVHSLPRGLSQKVVIALILAWLGWAVLALRRRSAR